MAIYHRGGDDDDDDDADDDDCGGAFADDRHCRGLCWSAGASDLWTSFYCVHDDAGTLR